MQLTTVYETIQRSLWLQTLLVIVLVTWALRAVLCTALGIRIGFVNPFLLKISNLRFLKKGVSVRVRSICFKLSLFGNSSVAIAVEGVEMTLAKKDTSSASSKQHDKTTLPKDPNTTTEELIDLDPDRPVSIRFESSLANLLLKYYLLYFRFVGVRFSDVLVTSEELGMSFHADSYSAKVDVYPHEKKNVSIKTRAIQQKINGVEVFDSCVLEAKGTLDFATGNLSGMRFNFDTRTIRVAAHTLLKKYTRPEKTHQVDNDADRVMSENELLQLIHRKLRVYCNALRLVEGFRVSFQGISVTEIPLATKDLLNCPDYQPVTFAHLKVDSFVMAAERLFLESPGYGLLYGYTDKPYRMVYNFTGLTVSMDRPGQSCLKEIISIPVMNFNGNSNVAFQTLEATLSGKQTNSKLMLAGHLSEPIIDMSTEDVCAVVTTVLDFLTYLEKQEFKTARCPPSARSEKSSVAVQTWEMIKNLSDLWPVFELKLGVENPVIMVKSLFEEHYYRILLLKSNMLSLELRTSRYTLNDVTHYTSRQKFDMHNTKIEFRNTKTDLDKRALRFEDISVKQELDILPHLRLSTTVHSDTSKLNLSNIHMLNGINIILCELDEGIVPQVREYRRFLNSLDNIMDAEVESPPSLQQQRQGDNEDKRSFLRLVQDMVPPWVHRVEVHCSNNILLSGSRSLLLNKELVKNLDSQTVNDLVNGELRTVSLDIESCSLVFSASSSLCSVESLLGSSSLEDDDKGLIDTSSESTDDIDSWSVKLHTSKIVGKICSERSSNKNQLHEKVFLKVPTSDITLKPCEADDKLILKWKIDRVDALYSVITHFILISCLHLVRNTVFEFMLKNPVGEERKSRGQSFMKKLIGSLEVALSVGFVDMILVLPDRMKMRLEFSDIESSGMLDRPLLVGSSFTRLCTESPTTPGYWTRLVTAVEGAIMVNIPAIVGKLECAWFELTNSICHITSPHHLITYKTFDNISVMVKTLKQLHHSLHYNSDEIVINPSVKGPTKVPKMSLKSTRVLFSMEDDPFEAELNMIFQIGLLEQKMRLEKLQNFEARVVEELEATKKPPTKAHTDDHLAPLPKVNKKKTFRGLHHPSSLNLPPFRSSRDEKEPSESKIATTLQDQKVKLAKIYEGFSKSWVARVHAYRNKMQKNFEESFSFLWGHLDGSLFPDSYNRKVLDFVRSPSLFNLILEGVDLDIGPPQCGYDGLADFLHDVGKGLPRDTKYSTLIPIHMDLRLTELRSHLRDYPLPFIHMPSITKSQSSDLPSVRVHGDLVIGENMITCQEEVREVYVPLVPGCAEDDQDWCYSLEVPKTLTSIKVYTKLDWESNSELASTVTWGTSYQPCIQQIMLNLDNFTKPPIDPSEKVGFWDKVRANFHARIKFHWSCGGDLNIVFKGSKNPYAIGGSDAGFMLAFKDSVVVDINEKGDPREFIAAKSSEIMFAVPNHFAKPLPVWSKSIINSALLCDVSTNFQKSAFGYYLTPSSEVDAERHASLASSYVEKSVIRLSGGVQFNLSFFFERKLDDGLTRSSDFSPHYDVILRNPKYVSDLGTYDAYRGFRSHFIHMGFTLVSVQESAYNTIQLTPVAFQYFFAWWKMFSNTLPIRHGQLFGPEKATKKFSRHLYTIKYQAIVEPLFISHVYHDFELTASDSSKIDCVGVKGRAKRFVLDLHQRKELTFEHNANLGVTKKSMNLKFNIGKVDLEELDMRVLEGFFDKDVTPGIDHHDPSITSHNFESFDNDLSWFDLSDFAEINEYFLTNGYRGHINAYPLMYTPRFVYTKKQSYGDKYQIDAETGRKIEPFGHESFHNCHIPGNPSVLTQQIMFDERLAELETKLENNLLKIETALSGKATPDDLRIAKQLKVDNEQLRHGIKFLKQLAAAYNNPENGVSSFVPPFDFALNDGPEEESFTNRFIVHNMMLKWNDKSRDGFYRYIYLFELRGTFSSFVQHKSLAKLDEAIDNQRKLNYSGAESGVSRVTTYDSNHSDKARDFRESMDDSRASQRMKYFKEELREIAVNFFYKTHDNYLVKLISPQIQLQCEDDKRAVVLVVAPKIELNIVAFDASEGDEENDESIFEQRFGAILVDASIFLFHENEIVTTGKLFFNSSSYGSTTAWPPWLGVELCYDGSLINDHVLMEKTSIMVRYDKVMNLFLGADEIDVNRLSCDLSKAVLTCDAKQYYSLYTMIMGLLIYNDPRTLKLKQRESKMALSLDLSDLRAIKTRIMALQDAIGHADDIIENLSSKRSVLDDLEQDDLNLVKGARFEACMELYLLMRVSVSGSRESMEDADDYLEWNIRADDIKLHMLDEKRSPFLDVLLQNSHFKRMERSDRSDRNHIVVENLEVINLDRQSNLPVVFSAYHVDKKEKKKKKREKGPKIVREGDEPPLIYINWQMDYPVGGIRIMKKFEVDLQPIQISIEELTGEKIMRYAFPNESPLLSYEDRDEDESEPLASVKSRDLKGKFTFGNNSETPKTSNGSSAKKIGDDDADSFTAPLTPITPRHSMSFSMRSRDGHIDSLLVSDQSSVRSTEADDGLDEMVQRASKYLSFVSFRLKNTTVCITFRGQGSKKLINVSNFVLNMPEMYFTNRTYTLLDLTMYIKKMLLKALLSHTGSIIGNKLSKRSSVEKSLKNLSNYATNRINTFRSD